MTRVNSDYQRQKLDQYFTPHWVPAEIAKVVNFQGLTCDPCAGGWNLVETLRGLGVACEGFDIDPDLDRPNEPWALSPRDFLEFHGFNDFNRPYTNYIFNPPYGDRGALSVRFIEHALDLSERIGGKVIAILPVDFDNAATRTYLFADCPAYAAEYKLTKRLRWTNVTQKKNGPTENHTVHVWDWGRNRPAIKGYLPSSGGL